VRHPESFRQILAQIANDVHSAFELAHYNMIKIQLEMDQVPDYVKYSIVIIQGRNRYLHRILVYFGFKPSLKEDLPNQLKKIKTAVDNGLNLSTEVSQAFDKLEQLNQQVILAITASYGKVTGGQEILNAINNPILNEIQLKLEGARKEVQRKKHQWVEARQFGVGDVFGLLLLGIPYFKRWYNARNALIEVEKKLKNMQQQRDNILASQISQMKVYNELNQNEMIRLLKEGIAQLSHLNSNWSSFTQNFNSINNYIEQAARRALTDFVENAKSVQEDTIIVHFIIESMNKSLESTRITSHNAKMYVEFSYENIVKPLRDMRRY
jgi:DNA-binding transcriptional regulator YbjK